MKYTITSLILAGWLPLFALSQAGQAGAGNAIARLEWARKNRPIESVHLHFDKPYYSSGDTIYFKAYVTMNEQHRPTPLSEVLHVDLIGPGDKIIGSVKLQLKQGYGHGDFALADTLTAGRYRVRAYTRWMRNEGPGSFFDAAVAVGSPKASPAGFGNNNNNVLAGGVLAGGGVVAGGGGSAGTGGAAGGDWDVEFMPEGGELLNGIETKVAFKATGKNGSGIKIKGIVVDDAGKEVTRFQAVHLGMGFFYLRPEPGKSYGVNISFADGTTGKVEIPKATTAGVVLAAENDTLIHVLANEPYLLAHRNELITLLICSKGSSSVTRAALSDPDIAFKIDTRMMHPGITRATLFTQEGEPVSERLLFIKGPDSMSLVVKSDKSTYGKKEKVEMTLAAQNRGGAVGQGNFSVSVINDNLLKGDENTEKTIFADLLLCSDLRGTIEQPNYYFAHAGDEVDANLDLLMLTQGYRHFAWRHILRDSLPTLVFKAEKFLQIQGTVRTTGGKPVKDETVTLTDTTGRGPQQSVRTDDDGRFAFSNLLFTDTLHFLLHPAKKGSRVVLIGAIAPVVERETIIEASPDLAARMTEYLNVAAQEHKIKEDARAEVLKPAVVKARALEKKRTDPYHSESLAGAGNADQVLHYTDFQTHRTLSDALVGRLNGVTINRGSAYLNSSASRMAVVLDGVELDPMFTLADIRVADVATVEVLRSGNASIYGMVGGGGVLVITTKKGDQESPEAVEEQDGLLGSFTGFYKGREFYSPKYDVPASNDAPVAKVVPVPKVVPVAKVVPVPGGRPVQDLRTTAYWQPELVTDKDGKASFSFYTSDLPGVYRVVVEGVDANGNPGRRVYRYVVQ